MLLVLNRAFEWTQAHMPRMQSSGGVPVLCKPCARHGHLSLFFRKRRFAKENFETLRKKEKENCRAWANTPGRCCRIPWQAVVGNFAATITAAVNRSAARPRRVSIATAASTTAVQRETPVATDAIVDVAVT
jgi:hypothetical protein